MLPTPTEPSHIQIPLKDELPTGSTPNDIQSTRNLHMRLRVPISNQRLRVPHKRLAQVTRRRVPYRVAFLREAAAAVRQIVRLGVGIVPESRGLDVGPVLGDVGQELTGLEERRGEILRRDLLQHDGCRCNGRDGVAAGAAVANAVAVDFVDHVVGASGGVVETVGVDGATS